jgi:hypothetical protein
MVKPDDNKLMIAFIQGAKWWEYKSTGATMWISDADDAEEEAWQRCKNGTLGKNKEEHNG